MHYILFLACPSKECEMMNSLDHDKEMCMCACVRDRFFSRVRSSFAMLRVFTKGVVTEITITCTLLSHLQAASDVTFSGLVLSP